MREGAQVFSGIYPALVTPMRKDGSVDEDSLRDLVRWLASFEIDGLYICGGTGEGILLSVEAREKVLDVVVDERSRLARKRPLRVIDHIGAVEASSAEELARHAEAKGADAISAIPPIYFGYSRDDIVRYYTWMSGLCELPLIIYASAQSGVSFTADMIKTISRDTAVSGLKFTSYDFFTLMQMRAEAPEGFTILNGGDEVFLFGLLAGADGGVGTTYNVMPRQFCDLYRAFAAGDFAAAKREQQKINAVVKELTRFPVIASVKAALELIGHPVGDAVFPNRSLTAEEKASLVAGLASVSFPEAYR